MHKLLLGEHAAAEVDSLHHAASGHDAQHCVEERVLWELRLVQALRQCSAWGDVHRQALWRNNVLIYSLKNLPWSPDSLTGCTKPSCSLSAISFSLRRHPSSSTVEKKHVFNLFTLWQIRHDVTILVHWLGVKKNKLLSDSAQLEETSIVMHCGEETYMCLSYLLSDKYDITVLIDWV